MKLRKIAFSLLLLTVFTVTGSKQEILTATVPQAAPSAHAVGITPYAEETIWHYRTLSNGTRQKRLWSITYSKWLTDWITIG